jgi:hypothetical protein
MGEMQVLLLVDPVEYEKIRPAYYEVAKIFRGKVRISFKHL